ncbi:hypothetical protein ECHSTV_0710 [Ehrlichia chaffeensis str. Saint Vincent]|nr:hypothetical protein ECHSTV_0710 [Ehrlichia chaffeensis str. Saint Vincent]AHX09670.1 hypothetical protein ECHWAK_0717 [Ehrlichia chaffeensis str. Wakulla]
MYYYFIYHFLNKQFSFLGINTILLSLHTPNSTGGSCMLLMIENTG